MNIYLVYPIDRYQIFTTPIKIFLKNEDAKEYVEKQVKECTRILNINKRYNKLHEDIYDEQYWLFNDTNLTISKHKPSELLNLFVYDLEICRIIVDRNIFTKVEEKEIEMVNILRKRKHKEKNIYPKYKIYKRKLE